MSADDDKLQRLLDGEIDEAEIAADPTLSSLAERIFGLTIEPIVPTKPSQSEGLPPLENTHSPSLDPMVEVIPGKELIPLPSLLTKTVDVKETPKKGGMLMYFGIIGVIVSVLNVFGMFALLLGSLCTDGICPDEGATRINWLSLHQITTGWGWGKPFPDMGIPDYVAILGSVVLIIVGRRK